MTHRLRFILFTIVLPAVALVVVVTAMIGCDEGAETSGERADAEGAPAYGVSGDFASEEEWGKYLVLTHGCDDCHTPKKWGAAGPEPDMARHLSGHPADEVLPEHDPSLVGMGPDKWILANMGFTAYVGPWGTSYAANLTPDGTGMAGWTKEQFMAAMTEGWYKGMKGTRKLLPPMPWMVYKEISEPELSAMFAYLQSIPPVENAIPAAVMAGPPPGAGDGGAPGGAEEEGEPSDEEPAEGDV